MSVLSPTAAHADRSVARRDAALPALPWLLDNTRLSELLGEAVHVTRVRYKPGTSLLVAYRRLRNGSFDHGWAHTAAAPATKLLGRESRSRSRGGNIRILRPDPRNDGAVVAVGDVAEDWALRRNLKWLQHNGPARLGLHVTPGAGLPAGSVLRYKPERRLVLLTHKAGAAVVIKTGAAPASPGQQPHFLDPLRQHGVPILPQLADAECLAHGISASPAWGTGDLAAHNHQADAHLAYAAGQALAALHCFPVTGTAGAGAADVRARDTSCSWREEHAAQLKATRSMVSSLFPKLEPLARQLESRLAGLLLNQHQTAAVLVHGDFSPDQVLVGHTDVRLIDFDRAGIGTAEADLGSFAAAEEMAVSAAGTAPGNSPLGRAPGTAAVGGPKTARLAEGYLDAGGRFTSAGMAAWAAFRLFNSSVDPFRDRSPEWAADMSWHLRRAKELIG